MPPENNSNDGISTETTAQTAALAAEIVKQLHASHHDSFLDAVDRAKKRTISLLLFFTILLGCFQITLVEVGRVLRTYDQEFGIVLAAPPLARPTSPSGPRHGRENSRPGYPARRKHTHRSVHSQNAPSERISFCSTTSWLSRSYSIYWGPTLPGSWTNSDI